MKISLISFTKNGERLAGELAGRLPGIEIELYTKRAKQAEQMRSAEQLKEPEKIKFVEESLAEWSRRQFLERRALVFIGACGIAVRAIAAAVQDKLEDSPVVVIDEAGTYVIPILSGHVGGANELAKQLASAIGALPVITTATDIHGLFAVDVFAKRNYLTIENKEGIAKVSAKILAGETVHIAVEGMSAEELQKRKPPKELQPVNYPPKQQTDIVISSKQEDLQQAVLRLRPKAYTVGIGCRRGKSFAEIDAWILKNLQRLALSIEDIAVLASIDVKKEEAGLLAWAERNRIPFVTFTGEELRQIEGSFQASSFVQDTVGVDNVCERAALAAAERYGRMRSGRIENEKIENGGKLVLTKQAEHGLTLAIAKREWSVTFEE